MTPATTLALARAVYPDCDWTILSGDVIRKNAPLVSCEDLPFDPITKPAQTLAVLCWLMRHRCLETHRGQCTSGSNSVTTPSFTVSEDYDFDAVEIDGVQSLAAAIVKAAGAVIEAKQGDSSGKGEA